MIKNGVPHQNPHFNCVSRVAIGIATSGRAILLSALLKSLNEQTCRAAQVFVSYVRPEDIKDVYKTGDIKFIQTQQGSCLQRNAILDEISNIDIILFIDDDCFLHCTYIEEVVKVFEREPSVVAASGCLLADGAQSAGITLADALNMLRSYTRPRTGRREELPLIFNTYGCNMAFRAATIQRLGLRFDERLAMYGWYEDVDFSRSLRKEGKIVRIEDAVAVHLGSKSGKMTGTKFGYAQIVNPIYLAQKGTLPWDAAFRSAGRHLIKNAILSVKPEPWIDRRRRAIGNFIAVRELIQGRVIPEKVASID